MSDNKKDVLSKELYELTEREANKVLQNFLNEEKQIFETLKIDCVSFDYSRESVIAFFKYVIDQFHKTGTYDNRSVWTLRLAYYFGESLLRSSAKLSWGLGSPKFADHNHPVVQGFGSGVEAPLIIISRNMVASVVLDGEPFTRVVNAANFWFDDAAGKIKRKRKKR